MPATRVFAYGSLMGDAVLGSFRALPARVAGLHRAFLHESRRRWGTPDHPCPILGLAAGGECWGLLFEIPDGERRRVESSLGKREAARERRRETRRAETPAGPAEAWVWVSRTPPGTESDLEAVEARLRAAHGVVGTGVEYVRGVVHALEQHGMRDPFVEELWARLHG
jgi:glutathione-specific gamma-glutamylcyclotransferase